MYSFILLTSNFYHTYLHSFPTRRSSDLSKSWDGSICASTRTKRWTRSSRRLPSIRNQPRPDGKDRKSTRLNSSHANISYAVFCLKKKKTHYYVRITKCDDNS